MDPVTLGMAKADAKKKYATVARPALATDLDVAGCTGSAGSTVAEVPDASGYGVNAIQIDPALRPTLRIESGRKHLEFNGTTFMQALALTTWPQPNTIACVVRLPGTPPASDKTYVGSFASGSAFLRVNNAGTPDLYAGSAGIGGGAPLTDAAWHVVVAVFDTIGCQLYVDGLLVGGANSQAQGTAIMNGLSLGATADGTLGTPVDIRQVQLCRAALNPSQVMSVSRELAAKHGLTLAGSTDKSATYRDFTINGQAARIWNSAPTATGKPLVIWSHPHSQNDKIAFGHLPYPLIRAVINEGWAFAASIMHGDSWGNAASQTDLYDLYVKVHSMQPVSKVLLAGGSMGGLASALSVPAATIPNIKGVAGIDAVFNLANMYANATYTGSIKTAHGIASDGSDYASKTAGFDPVLRSASNFTGVRWRFYASANDTAVNKAANADQMATLVAAAPEAQVVTHTSSHLSSAGVRPADFIAFAKRCFA
jgi:hypothetical protein